VTAKKSLCTLGPASLKPDVIAELAHRGIDLFRINLSHTAPDDVEPTIDFVQKHSDVPICLDTEGAQVRCGGMEAGVFLAEGQPVRLLPGQAFGDGEAFSLRPVSIFEELQAGNIVHVDSDGAVLRVTDVGEGEAEAIVVGGGTVASNKAVTIEPPPRLPSLTEHDLLAIQRGVLAGIRHFALSFANHADDVKHLRGLLPPDSNVIAKIESLSGVHNVEPITMAADAVLIDRGDLSREVPMEHVPIYQKHIIRQANALNTPVFVATNLLESMIVSRYPTLAESNDIFNTLCDGAHGLVLAAETAIGDHPVESVDAVLRMVDAFERFTARPVFGDRRSEPRTPAETSDG